MMFAESILEKLNIFLKSDSNVLKLKELLNSSTNYQNAFQYSDVLGKELFAELSEYYDFSSDIDLQNLSDDLDSILRAGYSETAYYAKDIQNNINSKMGIGMKALEPAVDKYRIETLLEQVKDGVLDNVREGTFTNITKSAVTDTIDYNGRVQEEAGLNVTITRHLGADGCCDWCRSIASTYKRGSEPKGFWQFHHDCDCWMEYKVNKKTSKITYQNGGKITQDL